MRMGINNWLGSLILFLSLPSAANPFYLALSEGIADSLVAAGVSQNQAINDADAIVSKRFGHNRIGSSNFFNLGLSNNTKPISDSTLAAPQQKSVIQDLFSDGVKKSLELRNRSGDRGIIYDVVENGNQADLEKLKKYYSDLKIAFKYGVSPDQVYRLTDLFTSETFKELGYSKLPNNLEVTVAPLWYEQMGMSVYRTESPITRRDGVPYYVFFDTLYNLYDSGFGYGFLKFPHVESVTVSLGKNKEDKEVFFDIYREEPDIYSDEDDADLSAELAYHNIYRLTYAFERQIRDYSANFDDDLAHFQIDVCASAHDTVECIYQGLTNNADISSSFLEEGRGEINIVKPDPKINNEEDKITESEDFDEYNKVEVHESFDGVAADGESKSVFGEDYKVTDEAMADIANEVIEQIKSSEIEGLSEESKNIISRSDFSVKSSNYSRVSASGGVSANDLSRSASSSFSEFDKVVVTRSGGKFSTSSKPYEKPVNNTPPVGPVADTNAGEASANAAETDKKSLHSKNSATTQGNSSSDTNIGGSNGSAIGSGTGSGAGIGSTSGIGISSGSSAGSFSTSNTNTAASTGAATATKSESDSDDGDNDQLNLPTLDEFDVLKPLKDWRENLLSKVQEVNVNGTCPQFSIEIFGTNISTSVHCEIFDSLRGALMAVMSLVWSFIAFRIVFEA